MINVFVDSVGLIAPGLCGWSRARNILRGESPYVWHDVPAAAPAILPAAERRRCIASARLAIGAANEALQQVAPETPRQLNCVFSSSDGDSQVIGQIMESLAQEVPDVSPIRFANSVHNATAGYWSIATGMTQGSTCLSAFDESVAAGLLEAAVQVADERIDCLLTASDVRFQEPFFALRPIEIDFAATLLLTPERTQCSFACLQIVLAKHHPSSALPAWLPESFASNPAARALPLLRVLAAPNGQTVFMDYLGQTLAVKVTAC